VAEMRITSLRVIDADREPVFLKNRPEVVVPPLDIDDRDVVGGEIPTATARRIRHLLVIDGGKED